MLNIKSEKENESTNKKVNSSNVENSEELENKIFFYSTVDDNECFDLNKQLLEIDKKNSKKKFELELDFGIKMPDIPIDLHIQSPGGYVLTCFGTLDYILNTKNPVHTYVDGYAASCGTLMSIVGKERYISEHSYMLIHQLSGMHWGNYEQLKDEMKNTEELMNRILAIYEKHAKIPKKELKEVLKHDLWWDAKKCLEYGLVDDII